MIAYDNIYESAESKSRPTIFLHKHRSIEGFPALPLVRMLRRLRGLGSAALCILQTPSQLNKA